MNKLRRTDNGLGQRQVIRLSNLLPTITRHPLRDTHATETQCCVLGFVTLPLRLHCYITMSCLFGLFKLLFNGGLVRRQRNDATAQNLM